MKVRYEQKTYTLNGDAWTPTRFESVKGLARPNSKVVVLDDNQERYLLPIKDLEQVEES